MFNPGLGPGESSRNPLHRYRSNLDTIAIRHGHDYLDNRTPEVEFEGVEVVSTTMQEGSHDVFKSDIFIWKDILYFKSCLMDIQNHAGSPRIAAYFSDGGPHPLAERNFHGTSLSESILNLGRDKTNPQRGLRRFVSTRLTSAG